MVHIATDTTTQPEIAGLFVRGQLDLNAMIAFREGLSRAMGGSRAVEIHLGEVNFIDGCGLSVLLDATARARRAGHVLSIADASACVRRLIEITETGDRLPPLSDPQETGDRLRPLLDRQAGVEDERRVGRDVHTFEEGLAMGGAREARRPLAGPCSEK